MSQLDMFLVSDGLMARWKIWVQEVGERSISDLIPIWIKSKEVNWGLKLFKFFPSWFRHQDFICFVKYVWDSNVVEGKWAFVLKEKLKLVKEKLRLWKSIVFYALDLQVDDAIKKSTTWTKLRLQVKGLAVIS